MAGRTDEIASTFLGKRTSGSKTYDPSLLVAVPRLENRKQYDIDTGRLPFAGWDVWHAYEFSAMTNNGIPVTRVLKLRYNCYNCYIVESKSLKLYLNSFNMSCFGDTVEECLEICKKTIERDLKSVLKTNVELNFLAPNSERIEIYQDFRNIMDFVDEKNLKIEHFKESPELIDIKPCEKPKEYYLHFDSLRSNCRVTHQPDFGDLFIYYRSRVHFKEDCLVKYLCSFRSEYHFHEECCEMIYKRLHDYLYSEDRLFVSALYTRRGGIDICPSRWSRNCKLEDIEKLIDTTKYARFGIKQ